jgi:general secretion pathway protein J
MRSLQTGRGFTLIELLVAITVLALVSLIAWRGLDSLVHTRERLLPENEDVRALLVAFGQMERDLAQLASPIFVPLASAPLVAHNEAPARLRILRMVAAGGTTALQAVIYELRGGRLLRLSSAPLTTIGPTRAETLTEIPLLSGVQEIRLRVWQQGQGWAPPEALANPTQTPPGLEVVVDFADGRQYRRVLLVGVG